MSDSTSQHGAGTSGSSPPQVDVSLIEDPHVRRSVRAVVQQNQAMEMRLRQQQQEIEALLQMMCEKHVGSVGEFKRHMLKLQAGDARGGRLHDQITAAPATPAATPAAAAPRGGTAATPGAANQDRPSRPAETRYSEPEVDRPRRYTL